jgi:hypothetical protein
MVHQKHLATVAYVRSTVFIAVKVYFDCDLLGYDLKMEEASSFETKHPQDYMVPQTQKTSLNTVAYSFQQWLSFHTLLLPIECVVLWWATSENVLLHTLTNQQSYSIYI